MISFCYIVKNEEVNLEQSLISILPIADEIIIVDTGSTDSTIEIASKYTDKIYNFEWCNDFSKARNFGLDKSTSEWNFVIDADERIFDYDGLRKLMTDEADIWQMKQQTIKDGMALYNNTARLMRNDIRYIYNVHEIPDHTNKRYKISNYIFSHVGFQKFSKEKNQMIIDCLINGEHPLKDMYMGTSYYNLGDYDKATEHFKLGSKTDYKYNTNLYQSYCYLMLGTISASYFLGYYFDANDNFEKSKMLFPKQNKVHLALADLKLFKNEYNEAKKELTEILNKNLITSDLFSDVILNQEQITNLIKEVENNVINNNKRQI